MLCCYFLELCTVNHMNGYRGMSFNMLSTIMEVLFSFHYIFYLLLLMVCHFYVYARIDLSD